MIDIGDAAPDFEVSFPTGERRPFSAYRGQRVALYFFPKANTAGCTVETRGLAEEYPGLKGAGLEVVGVSTDSDTTQTAFAERCGARFPLVGDPSKAIARSYGVLGVFGVPKRVTFLIDEKGVVRDRVEGMLPGPHVKAVKAWANPPAKA